MFRSALGKRSPKGRTHPSMRVDPNVLWKTPSGCLKVRWVPAVPPIWLAFWRFKMKISSGTTIVAFVIILALMGWATDSAIGSSTERKDEFSVSFKAMRSYDLVTHSFTETSYLVQTGNGLRCSAVFAADKLKVDQIEALASREGKKTWSGSLKEFDASGLPNPCP